MLIPDIQDADNKNHLSRTEIIRHLIKRKFKGFVTGFDNLGNAKLVFGISEVSRVRIELEIKKYKKELESKDSKDFAETYSSELQLEELEEKTKLEEIEKQRFFNLPKAHVDIEHWGKADYWTLDEATALSFGKEPEIVGWRVVEPYKNTSVFAKRYSKMRDLALRAKVCKELSDPVLPTIFIEWCELKEIEFCQELEKKVYARKNVVSWKILCEQNKKSFDDIVSKQSEVIKSQDDIISKLEARNLELLAQFDMLQEQANSIDTNSNAKDKVNKKSFNTLLKLVAGMAIKGFAYNPQNKKNPSIKEIQSDLDELGVSMDDETISHWIKEGCKIINNQS